MDHRRVYFMIAALAGIAGGSVTFWQSFRAPPDYVYSGFLHIDLPQIMSAAREIFETGDGWTFHPNPFQADKEAPAIYSHGLVTLLGHLWKTTGAPPETVFNIVGLICAPLMFLTTWPLVSRFVSEPRWRLVLGAVIVFGGGWTIFFAAVSWISTAAYGSSDNLQSLHAAYELDFRWWFANVSRNSLFATESFYHLFFLGTIVAYLHDRRVPCVVLAALACWSHPFTGAELTAVLVAAEGVEVLWLRNGRRPGMLIACVSVLATLLVYNLIYLASFPEHQFLMKQWTEVRYELTWRDELFAYGAFLVLPLYNIRNPSCAHQFFSQRRHRFLVVWVIVVYVLINNEAWFDPPLEPAHFTRGYLYLPLVLLSGIALEEMWRHGEKTSKRLSVGLAACCVTVPIVDNAMFAMDVFAARSTRRCVSRSLRDVYNRLETIPAVCTIACEPDTDNANTGYYLTVWTKHRPLVGHFITPYRDTKLAAQKALLDDGDLKVVERYDIDVVLLRRQVRSVHGNVLLDRLRQRGWTAVFENQDWRVVASPNVTSDVHFKQPNNAGDS